jgi:hypothetical protein
LLHDPSKLLPVGRQLTTWLIGSRKIRNHAMSIETQTQSLLDIMPGKSHHDGFAISRTDTTDGTTNSTLHKLRRYQTTRHPTQAALSSAYFPLRAMNGSKRSSEAGGHAVNCSGNNDSSCTSKAPLAFLLNAEGPRGLCAPGDGRLRRITTESYEAEWSSPFDGKALSLRAASAPQKSGSASSDTPSRAEIPDETINSSNDTNCVRKRGYWDVVLIQPLESSQLSAQVPVGNQMMTFDQQHKHADPPRPNKTSRKQIRCRQCQMSFEYQSHLRTRTFDRSLPRKELIAGILH